MPSNSPPSLQQPVCSEDFVQIVILRESEGRCPKCGMDTHAIVKGGDGQRFFLTPMTIDREVFNGKCLLCNSITWYDVLLCNSITWYDVLSFDLEFKSKVRDAAFALLDLHAQALTQVAAAFALVDLHDALTLCKIRELKTTRKEVAFLKYKCDNAISDVVEILKGDMGESMAEKLSNDLSSNIDQYRPQERKKAMDNLRHASLKEVRGICTEKDVNVQKKMILAIADSEKKRKRQEYNAIRANNKRQVPLPMGSFDMRSQKAKPVPIHLPLAVNVPLSASIFSDDDDEEEDDNDDDDGGGGGDENGVDLSSEVNQYLQNPMPVPNHLPLDGYCIQQKKPREATSNLAAVLFSAELLLKFKRTKQKEGGEEDESKKEVIAISSNEGGEEDESKRETIETSSDEGGGGG